jgi:hypothetical protein
MKTVAFLLCVTSLCNVARSNPVPDHIGKPRATTTTTASVAATITPGATLPTPQANPGGCADVILAGETRNDIVDGLPCKNFTLIFARGAFETGNVGGLVGPPFEQALESMLGSAEVAVQGVNHYPADVAGFLAGGSATGSQNMAQVRLLDSFSDSISLLRMRALVLS